MAATKPAPKVAKEDRIDAVGYAKQLVERWLTPLIDAIKKKHGPRPVLLVGEVFEATIVPLTNRSIAPTSILKLYDAGKLTKSQLISMLSIKVPVAEKVLDGATFKRLCACSPGEPQLRVKLRGEDFEVDLVDASREVAEAVGGL
jgi:hypothetical protein